MKAQVSSGAAIGKLDYFGSYARTTLDGYRDYAAQGRDRVNGHLGYALSEQHRYSRLLLFRARQRTASRAPQQKLSWPLYPTAANPSNRADRWGRDYDLHHLGLQLRTQLGFNQRLEVSPYFQYRDIDHPIFQVINQQSRDYGAEVRYENTLPLFGREQPFTLGVQPRGSAWTTGSSSTRPGCTGRLRKNQKDEAVGLGLYAEDALALTPRLTAVVGFRLDHSIRKARRPFSIGWRSIRPS